MDPFTVMNLRGHMMDDVTQVLDMRRRMESGDNDVTRLASGPVPTPRAGGRKTSRRDFRSPQELTRSRRVGLSATVCSDCGAVIDQGRARHTAKCWTARNYAEIYVTGSGHRVRMTTGPMAKHETSADTGWTS